MLSNFAAKAFISYTAKELGSFMAQEAPKLQEPALLVVLPTAIIKDNVKAVVSMPEPPPEFTCPNRAKLHEKCSDASFFDQLTIPPVNAALEKRNTPLTKESYKLLKQDMKHSAEMDFFKDPVHKKIADYHLQTESQRKISASFARAGEHEGALLHKVVANVFAVRANAYEKLVAPVESHASVMLGKE